MAFIGTAVVTQIKDNMVRVTGVSLAPGGEGGGNIGTVGLHGATGTAPDVRLPGSFKPVPYGYPTSPVTEVTLQDSIRCDYTFVDNLDQVQALAVAKTGTTEQDFRVTLTNTGGSTTSGIEFYITFHD
jgi:hypothetical protein